MPIITFIGTSAKTLYPILSQDLSRSDTTSIASTSLTIATILNKMTETRSRLTKKDKQAITARAVAATLADYFAGVTKAEAEEIFKVSPPDTLQRYATYQQALAGHAEIVGSLAGLKNE